jgi:meso-butanediol dehydrogenase/(S,S)-butanediol dehydrogenase/diacetyl reductase
VNQNIIVTGSSTGIGAGIAKHFADLGFNVIVTYKNNEGKAKEMFSGLNNSNNQNHSLLKLDVCSEKSVKKAAEMINKRYGHLNLVVCNAGVDYFSEIEKCSYSEWKDITRTKIDGMFLCTKYFMDLLKNADSPLMIYISASVGNKPDWRDPAYSCACAATSNFGKSMSVALAKNKIRSNIVCPGSTRTNMKYWDQLEKIVPDIWEKFESSNPLKHNCTPEDVAAVIEMLFNDKTKYINGNEIFVNGGAHYLS